jgi:cysteine desulfurase / selenocysteine lyase
MPATDLHAPAAPPPAPRAPAYDVDAVRRDFPILAERVDGHPLVYLDSAATSQKPQVVIDAVSRFYATGNANIHRGVYRLSEAATAQYEGARERIARFLNAPDARSIVFTRGTTESINLVAQSYLRPRLQPGDEILITAMEHHSNIVPWQLVAAATGAVLRVAPITDAGELDLPGFEALLSGRTRLVALAQISNSLGTVNPVEGVVALAHAAGVPVLVDGAQAAPHLAADIQALGCDFFACSGHKMFGPTGIGVLYGRADLLEEMLPWQGGGDMIASVTFERSTWAAVPSKFEAGTPDIAGVVGLGAAVDYLAGLDRRAVAAHEAALLSYASERVAAVAGVRLIGTAARKASVVSFVLDGVHPHDIATILDADGICIRAGHHCTQPLMQRLGVPATARASFALYSTFAEADALAVGLERVRSVMGR